MRRLMYFGLLVIGVGVFNLVLLVGGAYLLTAKAGPVASGNGDINGDGSINLADAVALLDYLFDGGAEPVAIAGSPADGYAVRWPAHPSDAIVIDFLSLSGYSPGDVVDVLQADPDEYIVVQFASVADDHEFLVSGTRVGYREISVVGRSAAPGIGVVVPPGESLQVQIGTDPFPQLNQLEGYRVPVDRPNDGSQYPAHPETMTILSSIGIDAPGADYLAEFTVGSDWFVFNSGSGGAPYSPLPTTTPGSVLTAGGRAFPPGSTFTIEVADAPPDRTVWAYGFTWVPMTP